MDKKLSQKQFIILLKHNRSANAYLFTGIRGVGKTTIARIVAKSLNCLKGIDKLCSKDFVKIAMQLVIQIILMF